MATENTKNFIDRNTGGALTKTGNSISSAKNSVLGMFGMSDKVIDNGDGSKTTVKSDGSKIVQDGGGTKTYDKSGKLISEKSPTFGGVSIETRADGSKVQSYDSGPMSGKVETTAAGGTQTTASYDLGVTKVAMRETLTPKQMREREIGARMEAGLPNKIPREGGANLTKEEISARNTASFDKELAQAEGGTAPVMASTPRGGQSMIAGEPWKAGQKLSSTIFTPKKNMYMASPLSLFPFFFSTNHQRLESMPPNRPSRGIYCKRHSYVDKEAGAFFTARR
jgi:hypothetical protein